MVGHGLDVKSPVEFGHKEDAQVTDGLGNRNSVGRVGPGREEDGSGGEAKETGSKAGRVEEHEFRLVEVNGEAGEGKPGADLIPGCRDLSDSGEEGGAQGIDVAVVDIEGEINIVPV